MFLVVSVLVIDNNPALDNKQQHCTIFHQKSSHMTSLQVIITVYHLLFRKKKNSAWLQTNV